MDLMSQEWSRNMLQYLVAIIYNTNFCQLAIH